MIQVKSRSVDKDGLVGITVDDGGTAVVAESVSSSDTVGDGVMGGGDVGGGDVGGGEVIPGTACIRK